MGQDQDAQLKVLQDLQLRMQSGDLQNLERKQRAQVFASLCSEEEAQRFVDASMSPRRRVGKKAAERLKDISRLIIEGRELGRQLVEEGHPKVLAFEQVPFIYNGNPSMRGQYAMSTDDAVTEKIYDHIRRRVGNFDKGIWRGVWHLINVVLFSIVIFSSAIAQSAEDGEAVAAFMLAAWLFSLSLMVLVRGSKRLQAKSPTFEEGYLAQWRPLERPLREGVEASLIEAEAQRKAEMASSTKPLPKLSEKEKNAVIERVKAGRLERSWDYVSRHLAAKSASASLGSQAYDAKRAEELCADWLRSKGEPSAKTTKDGADGGVDIRSHRYVAQVKNYRGSVGVQPIRELFGIAAAEGKTPLFFTSGRYTEAAKDFANEVGMALIVYESYPRLFKGANQAGRNFC